MYSYSFELVKRRFSEERLTLQALSTLTGIQIMTVQRIMKGTRVPDAEELVLICNALGISPRSLFAKKA